MTATSRRGCHCKALALPMAASSSCMRASIPILQTLAAQPEPSLLPQPSSRRASSTTSAEQPCSASAPALSPPEPSPSRLTLRGEPASRSAEVCTTRSAQHLFSGCQRNHGLASVLQIVPVAGQHVPAFLLELFGSTQELRSRREHAGTSDTYASATWRRSAALILPIDTSHVAGPSVSAADLDKYDGPTAKCDHFKHCSNSSTNYLRKMPDAVRFLCSLDLTSSRLVPGKVLPRHHLQICR